MANNEIKTIFTIDKTQFDKSIKELNKMVSQAKKEFNGVSSEARELAKELTTISKQLDNIDGLGKLPEDIKACVNGIKQANKEFSTLNKEIVKAQKEMKDMGKVDLSSVKQLQTILKSLKNYDVIKESDLKSAVNDAREIAKQLNSIKGIDTSGLNKRINTISDNTVFSSYNNSDAERYLKKISASINEIENKIKNNTNDNNQDDGEEVSKAIDKLSEKLLSSFNKLIESSSGIEKAMKTINANVARIDKRVAALGMSRSSGQTYAGTSMSTQTNPFLPNELRTVVQLYDQLLQSEQTYNRFLKISNENLDKIANVYKEICKQQDEAAEKAEQFAKEQEQIRQKTERAADEAAKQANSINDAEENTSRLRSVYESLARVAQRFGINLPDLGEVDETRSSIQGLSQALQSTTTASEGASTAASGFSASIGAVAAAIVAVTAVVAAYVMALKKCVDAMQQASKTAGDFESATAKLANQLGITSDGVDKLRDSLNEAFRNQGYTTDINELSEAFAILQQYLDIDVDSDYGQTMLNRVMAVAKSTGYEVKELSKTIDSVSKNFKVTQEEALDGIMYMYQVTGDKSNDLLDTFSEYSMKVRDMNMSYETFLSSLKAGNDAALFNTDKVGQIIEELNDTLTTEADDSVEILNEIGLSYSKLVKGIQKGGKDAQQAFYAIIEAINDVEDEAKRQNIISELFKSPGQEVSMEFFQLLEEARVGMEELQGVAEETARNIQETFSYQMNQAQNNISSVWDKIGEGVNEVVTPALKAFNDNFDKIMEVVESDLVPAFQDLAYAIAYAFGIDTPQNFADALVGVVKGIASVIEFVAKLTFAIGKVCDVVRILWNMLQIVYDGFKAGIVVIGGIIASFVDVVIHSIELIGTTIAELLTAIKDSILDVLSWISQKLVWLLKAFVTTFVDAFNIILKSVGNILGSMVSSFDDAFMLIIKAAGNLGIGIVNSVVIGAKKAYNGFLKYFVNPAISAANLLPGVNINPISYVDETGVSGYISIQDQLSGLKDAWSKQSFDISKELSSITNIWSSGSSVGKTEAGNISKVWSNFANNVGNNFNNISSDFAKWENAIWSATGDELVGINGTLNGNFEDLGNALDRLFGVSFEEYKNGYELLMDGENENTDKIVQAIQNSNTNGNDSGNGKYNGKDPVPGSSSSSKTAENQKKEYEQALKDAQQAQYDFYKNLIDAYAEAQEKMISYETAIAEQKWSIMDESRELCEDQIQFYQSIMDRYILTTDQMISYTQQKFEAAVALREWALEKAKSLIEEEVEAEKEALEEEKDALIKANNEKIKEYEKYIKDIKNQISDLEDEWDKEDRQDEIDKVRAELEKVANASSVEGIKKRNELIEQLNDLLKEQERQEIKDRLEDQVDGWEEQIDGLEEANDNIEEEYDNKYKELEQIVTDGEMTIADIQEAIRDASNEKLKEQLQEMVEAYESAMQSMENSTLNMQTIMGWEQNDKEINDTVNNLTGQGEDLWSDLVQNTDKQLNPDYIKLKELQEQWATLGDGKNSDNPQIKAQQDKLHAQAEAIRKKWNVTYPDNPPKYIQKYHTGGVVSGDGEVDAKLLGGEVVFTHDQFQKVIDFFDYFDAKNLLKDMKSSSLQGSTTGSVTYNDTFNMNIGTITMNNNADVRQFMQEAEIIRKKRNNSAGKRNI